MDSGREILVRVSLGDARMFIAYVRDALAHRQPSRMWEWWQFVCKQRRRPGAWKPFTVGDHVMLRRKRAHMRHWPRRTPWPAPWRHYAQPWTDRRA